MASPLLELNITGAQGILFNITGSSNLTLWEVTEAAEEIRAAADPEANIIFGTSFNERLGDEVLVTVIATGYDGRRRSDTRSAAERERERSGMGRQPVGAVPPVYGATTYGSAAPAAPSSRGVMEAFNDRYESPEPGPAQYDDPAPVAVPVRAAERPAETTRRTAWNPEDLEIPAFLRQSRDR